MGCAAWLTYAGLDQVMPGPAFVLRLVRVSAAIAVAIAVLLASARLLRVREFDEARRRVLGRLVRRSRDSA
jgi:hypothetical protein